MARLSLVSTPRKPELPNLVEDYLRSAEARGLAPSTVDNSYGYPLRRIFLPWCAEEGIDSIEGLDAKAVDSFSAYLLRFDGKNGRLSRHSVHAYARAVRTPSRPATSSAGHGLAGGLQKRLSNSWPLVTQPSVS